MLVPSVALAQAVPAPPASFDLEAAMREGPPMTEARAVELALANSTSAEQARAQTRAAQAQVAAARVAMVPRLELTARYSHVDGFPDGTIGLMDPAAVEQARAAANMVTDPAARGLFLAQIDTQARGTSIAIPRDQIGFQARLTFPVSDLFFAMLPALESSEAALRAQRRREEVADNDVRLMTREAYLRLAQARGLLAVTTQARLQAEAQRAQIESAVRAGFMTEADRLAVEARVAGLEQSVAGAEQAVALADAALRMLTGEESEVAYGIAEPLTASVPEPQAYAVVVQTALARRAELEAIRETITAQRAAGRASDARGLPHLALYGVADVSNPSPRMIPPRQEFQPSWELGALLTWSPNDTWAAVHQGEQLASQVAAMEAQLDQLERAVRLEVRQATEQMRTARRAYEAAERSVEAAQAAYDARDAQLRAGGATSADVTAASVELDRARLSLVSAGIDLRVARARLAHAIGE